MIEESQKTTKRKGKIKFKGDLDFAHSEETIVKVSIDQNQEFPMTVVSLQDHMTHCR